MNDVAVDSCAPEPHLDRSDSFQVYVNPAYQGHQQKREKSTVDTCIYEYI